MLRTFQIRSLQIVFVTAKSFVLSNAIYAFCLWTGTGQWICAGGLSFKGIAGIRLVQPILSQTNGALANINLFLRVHAIRLSMISLYSLANRLFFVPLSSRDSLTRSIAAYSS
jgi:hypothetical protein